MRFSGALSVTVAASLMLQGCASSGFTMTAESSAETRRINARVVNYSAADCTVIPPPEDSGVRGFAGSVAATFVVTVVANIVRGEVVRRMNAEQEKFSKTYGVRTNIPPRPLQRCIAVVRAGNGRGATELQAVFRIVPLSSHQAMTIEPVFVKLDKSVAQARGRDQKFTVTITLAMSGVMVGETGPTSTAYFSQAFTFSDLYLGAAADTIQLGEPAPYLPLLPENRPMTLAASVTERGSGSEFYRDISTALSANEDAIQALIDGVFGEED